MGGPWRRAVTALSTRATYAAERARGLDFSRVVTPDQVDLDVSVASRSSPSGDEYLRRVIAELDVGVNDRILDIGCGKGSAMRCFLETCASVVDGIELSPELAAIAEKNFRRLGETRSRIFVGDACSFDGYGDYTILYMYNPFPALVMENVLSLIRHAGAEVVLIYNNPVCHDNVVDAGFTLLREYPDRWGNGIRVYAN